MSIRCLIAALLAANIRGETTDLSKRSALVVQNKGGGHGELGYQLAKILNSHPKISSVTILQDDAYNYDEEPFKSYHIDLPNVTVINAPLGDDNKYYCIAKEDMQGILGGRDVRFDYVWDNASQGAEGAGKALCDCAKDWDVKLYTYVSSADLYEPIPNGPFPIPETTPIKENAGQKQLEEYAVSLGLPLVSFRPQYIYGPKANKYDYVDYFFDRLVRELPIPIPFDGQQLVSLTCSEDVASLLVAPLENEAAAVDQRYFNCGTDQLVTYSDVAHMCAEAAGLPADRVTIQNFDANKLGNGDFPFRPTNFYVAPDTAKTVLGWPGARHNLREDLKWYYEGYVARGGPTKKLSLIKDWEIVVGSNTPLPEYMATIYKKYDPNVKGLESGETKKSN